MVAPIFHVDAMLFNADIAEPAIGVAPLHQPGVYVNGKEALVQPGSPELPTELTRPIEPP